MVALLAKEAGHSVVYLLQMMRVSATRSHSVAVTVWQPDAGTDEPVVMVVLWLVGTGQLVVLQHTRRTFVLVHDDPGHHTDDHVHSSSLQVW